MKNSLENFWSDRLSDNTAKMLILVSDCLSRTYKKHAKIASFRAKGLSLEKKRKIRAVFCQYTQQNRRLIKDEYDAVDVGAMAPKRFHGVGEKMLNGLLADAHLLGCFSVGQSVALAEQQGLALAVG